MIRILVFGLSPNMGGVETYLMNLIRNIDRRKIQFDFVVEGYTCYFSKEIYQLGGTIFYITPKKDNLIKNIVETKNILKKCKKTHEIVYFNLSVLYYNLPFILAKFYKYPFLLSHGHSARSIGSKKNLRYYLHCLNRIYVAKYSNHLFACSKIAGEWVFGKGIFLKENIEIVPNGIITNHFRYDEKVRLQMRHDLGIKNEQLVIGSVGRFSYEKNYFFLIEVFNILSKMEENTILLLVGDGELGDQLKDKVEILGLENRVIFTGERTDISNLLQSMDVFVLPSLFEGFGIALIEAQATGLHCFTSKDRVPHEVNITGNVNFVELDEVPEKWAEEIMKSLCQYERKDYSKKIVEAGFDIKETSLYFQEFILAIRQEKMKD